MVSLEWFQDFLFLIFTKELKWLYLLSTTNWFGLSHLSNNLERKDCVTNVMFSCTNLPPRLSFFWLRLFDIDSCHTVSSRKIVWHLLIIYLGTRKHDMNWWVGLKNWQKTKPVDANPETNVGTMTFLWYLSFPDPTSAAILNWTLIFVTSTSDWVTRMKLDIS